MSYTGQQEAYDNQDEFYNDFAASNTSEPPTSQPSLPRDPHMTLVEKGTAARYSY